MTDALTLYIDAEITSASARDGTVFKSFGPFRTYDAAERALTVLMARENVRGAIIRNPNP